MKDKSEEYWKEKLSPRQYEILRNRGTDAPFTSELLKIKDNGLYTCAACGNELFSSEHKFDSGSGWPSFNDVIKSSHVDLIEDNSHGMKRIEVACAQCGGHLGHLFNDAPNQPTGMRYCINGTALKFKKGIE